MARAIKDHLYKAFVTNVNGTSSLLVDGISTIASNTDRLSPVDFMDTPLLVCSSVNIPASASAPLVVVASLAAAVKTVQLLDTTGEWLGLYTGTTLLAIFGPGSTRTVDLEIAAGTAIGIRNMKNALVNVAEVVVTFFG